MLGGDSPTRPSTPSVARPAPKPATPGRASRWTQGHVPGEIGLWVFIVGDMLVFGVFFGVFMVERGQGLEAFRAGRESLNTLLGVMNTLLLLTGSILVVLAMRAIRDGLRPLASRLILGAMGTGALFIVDKGVEYGEKLDAGLTPRSGDFYTLFFAFTGIHLVHLIIGMAALLYMHKLTKRPQLDSRELATLESCASYWHLVDLLWLALFPLFYLVA